MLKSRPAALSVPDGSAGTSFTEAPAWKLIGAGWRPLFGSYRALGFSIEWHEFKADAELDWARSFHPASLELCLNLEGQGTLSDNQRTVNLTAGASVFYFHGQPPLTARRRARERHRFVTVEFAAEFLKQYLQREAAHLHPCVRAALESAVPRSIVTAPAPMSATMVQLAESLRRCPVFKPAQETWFRCKALELAAQSFFCPPEGEMFCTRQQRVACERAARAREILKSRLAEPPSLEELGRLVGCSAFYLSRQFSQATGLTIQQFVREARLERAAEFLKAGRHNVTEAALEVGYNSLSHFTVAFREKFGCCPGLYALQVPAPGGSRSPVAKLEAGPRS